MTGALAVELAPCNILVNHIVPGAYNAHVDMTRIPFAWDYRRSSPIYMRSDRRKVRAKSLPKPSTSMVVNCVTRMK